MAWLDARRAWLVESAAIVGATVLVTTDSATVFGGAAPWAATAGLVAVTASALAAAFASTPPARLSPLLLIVLVAGLSGVSSDRLAVLGLALGSFLPLAALYATRPRTHRSVAWLVSTATLLAALSRVAFRDPFRELRCAPACVANPFLIERRPRVVRISEQFLGLTALALVLAWVLTELGSRRGRTSAVTAPIVAIAAVWAARLLVQPRPVPDDRVDLSLFLATLCCIVALAAIHAAKATGVAVTRRRISQFVRTLSVATNLRSIEENLRGAVRDPMLAITLGDMVAEPPTASITQVRRGGRTVATIRHRSSVRVRLDSAIDPAVALALEIEFLRQQARHQLAEIELASATAVARSNEARRRLERNLHDGAQQRLLLVGMQLSHAASIRPDIGFGFSEAASEVADALADLRRIGRGDAAIIAELGLESALSALVGESDLDVIVGSAHCADPAHDCWEQEPATTAYRVVVGSSTEAVRAGASELRVELACLGSGRGRSVATSHACAPATDRVLERDRVIASGGRIVTDDRDSSRFEAWLP